MRCPSCGTHHPPQYEQCVSCGQDFFLEDNDLAAAPSNSSEGMGFEGAASTSKKGPEHFAVKRTSRSLDFDGGDYDESNEGGGPGGRPPAERRKSRKEGSAPGAAPSQGAPKRRSQSLKPDIRSGSPVNMAVFIGGVVLLIIAGASIFFLTKPPEEEVMLNSGLKQLENGQYAFAVETLTKASKIGKPNPKIMMALARAYVGVDQVDSAWNCISQAKQMGNGVAEDPQLASQLAGYYRMHNRYDKAVELLRPLAIANVPGKKAELADLDALWGDEELRDGKLASALTLWEEVKTLKDGSRYNEADNRLATIYQRLAGKLIDDKKDNEALVYLNKLNAIAENPRNYETCADIYERTGQLELAIDQLRKAQRLAAHDDSVTHKLAALLTKRGKELLDAGELDTGYGYLQQARSVDPKSSVATVTLKSVSIDMQGSMPHISGQVWNPTDLPINALSMKTDLVDVQNDRIIWTKESRVVDEYVPPLGSHEGKRIDVASTMPARFDGSTEWRIYFDGKLYNSYLVGKKDKERRDDAISGVSKGADKTAAGGAYSGDRKGLSGQSSIGGSAPLPGNAAGQSGQGQSGAQPTQGQSSEEKTMKDLGF
ncbi:MAG: tetratricopeptide repeat protein [Cyanobacteria bacterium REEB67]|nr:tetratricopeptide repeat protein [Cyanobacteria bacterium REEB67]